MGKFKFWGLAVLIVLLISAATWLVIKGKSETFVYSDEGILYWIEFTSLKGKVEGTYHQKKVIDEIGKVPFIDEKEYPITGKTTEKGLEIRVANTGEHIDARYSGNNLSVEVKGEEDAKLFQAATDEKLDEYEKKLQEELQIAIDQSEEKWKNFIRTFFSELKSVYGYFSAPENGEYQLFLKIDEALLEGEISGSFLMMADTGNQNNPYEEVKYEVNGITDGNMLKLYTNVDGKDMKMEGNFHEDARSFDLSFWMTNERLSFHAVKEEEFKQSYEEFKTKVQKKE